MGCVLGTPPPAPVFESELEAMGWLPLAADKSDAGLEKAFQAIDTDKSGKISPDELKEHIKGVYGRSLSAKKLNSMFTEADTNGDGEVDLQEFKVIMRAAPSNKPEIAASVSTGDATDGVTLQKA